ncbi:DUF664 domain-containing protein [Arthrobacter sp.]
MAGRPGRDGSVPNLRWILVHVIEGYSRHAGLLREAVDGLVRE